MVQVGWDRGYFDVIDAPRSWFLKEKDTPGKWGSFEQEKNTAWQNSKGKSKFTKTGIPPREYRPLN